MHNIGQLLVEQAARAPQRTAVVVPASRDHAGRYTYRSWTFEQLERETRSLARGLLKARVPQGARLVLFVPFSWEFITLTYALLRAGMTAVLVDPGMGKANIVDCLCQVRPQGFVAVSKAQAIRVLKRKLFPEAVHNVTVGRRWFWGGETYRSLLRSGAAVDEIESRIDASHAHDQAAVIFTSGSTGPPKGVVYEHGMFFKQVELIRRQYGIEPGEADLPGFPLFGLFNAAMGVTTVIPDMDPTRPADVDPERILTQIRDQNVTQAFGSPAFWNGIGRHCEQHGITLPTIRRALSAGGPVPIHVLERMSKALTCEGAELHTPFGATESLPVATIGSREVLQTTAPLTRVGRGTCVGRLFDEVEVKIIRITDGPIEKLSSAEILRAGEISSLSPTEDERNQTARQCGGEGRGEGHEAESALDPSPLPLSPAGDSVQRQESVAGERGLTSILPLTGEVGEIIVSGPSITREYFQHDAANRLGKIIDDTVAVDTPLKLWHRIGDVGYFDDAGRLWFCGRKAHVVHAADGPMFSVCCEAIFDEHSRVYRSALIGLGTTAPFEPAIVIEPEPGCFPATEAAKRTFTEELLTLGSQAPHTAAIKRVFFHPAFPVDTRHNVKINREALREWAMREPQ